MGAAPAAPAKSGGTGKYVAIGCGALLLICCVTSIVWWVVCGGMAALSAPVPGPTDTSGATAPAPTGGGGGVIGAERR